MISLWVGWSLLPLERFLHRRGQVAPAPLFLCLNRQLVYPSQITCWSNWGFLWKGERIMKIIMEWEWNGIIFEWMKIIIEWEWNGIIFEWMKIMIEWEWNGWKFKKRLSKWLTEQIGVWGPKFRTLTYDWMSPFAEKIVVQLVDMAQANENHAVDPYLWPEETSHHWMMKRFLLSVWHR